VGLAVFLAKNNSLLAVHPLHKNSKILYLMLFAVKIVVLSQAHLVGQLFVRYGVLHGVLKGQ
jgi:hypothetical protein